MFINFSILVFCLFALTHSITVQVVDPGIPLRALLLARGELPGVSFVTQIASALLFAAPTGSVGEVAVEDGGGMDLRQWLRVSGPGYQFLRCHKINIGKSEDGVDKLEEALLTMGPVEEPSGVEEQGERGFALGVVLQEVLGEDFLDGVGIFGVETTVSHGAGSSSDILKSLHGYFPHTRMGFGWTGLHAAAVRHLILKGVRP